MKEKRSMSDFARFMFGLVIGMVVMAMVDAALTPSYEDGIRDCALGKGKYHIEITLDTTVVIDK